MTERRVDKARVSSSWEVSKWGDVRSLPAPRWLDTDARGVLATPSRWPWDPATCWSGT